MAYKCGNCGHIQYHDNGCEECLRRAKAAARKAQQERVVRIHVEEMMDLNRFLESTFNPNNRCCGCTKPQRAIIFPLLGAIIITGGLIFVYTSIMQNSNGLGVFMIFLGIIIMFCGFLKPDFCLGNDQ